MIDINTALQNILKAIYGKDVRQSIHDAIYQINQNANEAVDLAQIKFGTDIIDPTSPVGEYIEGTVYFNVATGIIWKLSGGSWSQLGNMKTINKIEKTSTSGLVDTYTITYNDETTTEYTVTNGEKGVSVTNITKTSTTGNVDHYEVNLSDGSKTPNGFDVSNGISIENIELESQVGNVKNYGVRRSDGSKTPNGFSVADGVSSYVHIRYSANFDGTGMVTIPSDQTVYIGICVTTQTTAPIDPAVYSWVRFIGKSGTGSGDMLASDYATLYANTVDRAAALYDGQKEISANQLMDKSTYADENLTETVKKATTLVDKVNNKEADTEVLAKFSQTEEGKLLYDNKSIEPDIDNETIVRNEAGEMTLGSAVTTKLQTVTHNENNGYLEKNLLIPTMATTSLNGVSCTNNGDGTYTLSGKATAEARFIIATNIPIPYSKLRATGTPSELNGIGHAQFRIHNSSGSLLTNDTLPYEGLIKEGLNTSNGDYIRIDVVVLNGSTIPQNTIFRPMICNADVYPNTTYEDYTQGAKSNSQITKELQPLSKIFDRKALTSSTHSATGYYIEVGNLVFVIGSYNCQNATSEVVKFNIPTAYVTKYAPLGMRDNGNGNLLTAYLDGTSINTYKHTGTMTVGNVYHFAFTYIK